MEILINQYLARFIRTRPYIVGIDGLSGSGKTTLTKELERQLIYRSLKVQLFHLDDYVVGRSKRYLTGYPEWYEYYALQWDIANLSAELFGKLQQGKKKIAPDTIVLIEGVFLQRTEWQDFYDFFLYVDCPRELRYERTLRRSGDPGNLGERRALYSRRYWPGEDHYLSVEQPQEKADLIVKTNN
ncbi:AAA family ATPase [Planococcus sp. N028]|uniref:AAA family ATPase n=1 Tax=Planococcus shixiaomingii TaxID=3058393 RepID=A0ABT8MX66_9BACL|nr:AAA family ATPase [Planococcus sp. N028]MDN7240236.1 AAA family ATPase [Planococcus sp. N028]